MILLRWRIPRAFNPFIGRWCWCQNSCWHLAPVNDLGPHQSVQLWGMPRSGTAPGAWPQELKGKRALCTKEQKNIEYWILHCWRSQGEHCGTGGNTGKKKLSLSCPRQDLVLMSCSKEHTALNLPSIETYCLSISEAAKSHQIILKHDWINSYLRQFSNFKYSYVHPKKSFLDHKNTWARHPICLSLKNELMFLKIQRPVVLKLYISWYIL